MGPRPTLAGLALAALAATVGLAGVAPTGVGGALDGPAPPPGVRLDLRLLGDAPHRAGGPAELEVVVRNPTDQSLPLGDLVNDLSRFTFAVTYRPVPGAERAPAARLRYTDRLLRASETLKNRELVVAARGERSYRFPLGRMFDLSDRGYYTVRVAKELRPHVIDRAPAGGPEVVFDRVESPELGFELVDP